MYVFNRDFEYMRTVIGYAIAFIQFIIILLGSSGAELLSEPFQCCILPNFIHENAEASKVCGTTYLQQLKDELLRLKFYEKNNDLYQFHQVSYFNLVLIFLCCNISSRLTSLHTYIEPENRPLVVCL